MNAGSLEPRGERRIGRVIAIAAGVTLLVAAVAVFATRDRWRSRQAPGTQSAGDMAGMPGMDMSASGTARLTADQIRHFGVTVGSAEVRALNDAVRAVGYVTVAEQRIVDVAPRFGGFAERVYVGTTGAPVHRGEALLSVYSPELLAAQQELLAARALERAAGATRIPGVTARPLMLESTARERLILAGMRDAQIDSVLASGVPLRNVTITAPASGIVLSKHVVEGQAFAAGAALYRIADLAEVWVEAELRGSDATRVAAGARAEMDIEGLRGRRYSGRVDYVYPTLDAAARTVRVRIVVANSNGLLRPGMFATVRMGVTGRTALSVPSSAIVRTGERTIVFVDLGSGEYAARDVETGAIAGEFTEVLAGVEPGQRVVTSAQFLLDSESNLGDVMRAMMSQMGLSDMGEMGATRGKDGR